LLVWRSVFSLLSDAHDVRLVALVPDPAFLVSEPWLACFPWAAVPLMPEI
jgi:hypothetical protein